MEGARHVEIHADERLQARSLESLEVGVGVAHGSSIRSPRAQLPPLTGRRNENRDPRR
jgi:hypothetical protein